MLFINKSITPVNAILKLTAFIPTIKNASEIRKIQYLNNFAKNHLTTCNMCDLVICSLLIQPI